VRKNISNGTKRKVCEFILKLENIQIQNWRKNIISRAERVFLLERFTGIATGVPNNKSKVRIFL
jgi:tryptophan 2,3-dioxygenase